MKQGRRPKRSTKPQAKIMVKTSFTTPYAPDATSAVVALSIPAYLKICDELDDSPVFGSEEIPYLRDVVSNPVTSRPLRYNLHGHSKC